MVQLYGRSYTRRELMERVDDMSQLAGVRPSRLQHGPEDGVEVLDFWTGSGLRFTVVPSRAMDISVAEHRGKALAPRAVCREVHPAFFEPGAQGWRRGFFEGLLTTCGPVFYTEPPRPHELRPIGHGRATYTPARNVCYDEAWDGDEYRLWASGRMREDNLVWERKISTALGATSLVIRDRVENQGPTPIHHRFQYHINAGFPVVDAGSEFIASTLGLYTRRGEPAPAEFRQMQAPSLESRSITHDELMVADAHGDAYAALINPACEGEALGYWIRYRLATLPYFFLWKSLTPERYIVGTEPASTIEIGSFAPVAGSHEPLDPLAPGEERTYEIEIGVVAGAEQAAAMRARMAAIVSDYLDRPLRPTERLGSTQSGRHGF